MTAWTLIVWFTAGSLTGGISSQAIGGFSEQGCREAVKVVRKLGNSSFCVEIK